MSDEDISRAIATFGPMDDCPAPVEASAASRSDITMEIEESDEVEIIAGDSAAEPSNGASPSVPQQLISDRSVKRDRLPPLDTRQARRKYRMIAAIIGLFLGGASFALVGLFLREGQEHFEKRKIAAISPVPVTAAPVAPQPVTAASSAPTPDPIPQPPQPPQPPVVDAAPQPEDRPIATGDTVVIRLSQMAKGASVFVEGKEAELPLVVPRSRSIIKIEARAPGYRTVVKRIIPGSDKTVRMKMLSSSASSKKSSPKPSRPSTSSQWRPAGTHRKK